ncbi:M17 family peptidase N-terminal domain-containing protein, partial [Streptomyces hygroscopicus]|uniref:M17 family peptidase N-terminal domain-containing protein n=1 Tax=Streptomyces hygroscopicus TaxID=1912 RepID=UPI0036D0CAFB
MTVLTLSTSSAAALRADAVVVGVAKGAKSPVVAAGAEAVDKAFGGKLAAVLETLGATGAEGEVTKLPSASGLKAPVVLAVGLGEVPAKGDGYDAETLRRAAGVASRALSGSKKGAFALPIGSAADAGAVAEGALLGAYAYDKGNGNGKNAKDKKNNGPLAEVALVGTKPRDKEYKAAAERATALVAEVNRARDLINTPSNVLTPAARSAAGAGGPRAQSPKKPNLGPDCEAKTGVGR